MAIFLLLFPSLALGNTYQVFDMGGPRQIYGIDSLGNVVIRDIGSSCDVQDNPCYDLFHLGAVISYSTTAPMLDYDDGGPCSTVDTGIGNPTIGVSVCNGSREAFWADYGWTSGLFSGPDPFHDLVYSGPVTFLMMNAQGDIAFTNDADYQAIDLNTQAPEPGSWLLAGSGTLGLAGAMRRRWIGN
jgi:hypothetical protein